MKTRITELLGIKYPIFQGAMAWISDGKLAAAVSNGGGLGIIGPGNADVDYVRKQIAICRSLTDRPFGVNIMLKSPFAPQIAELLAEERVPVITSGAGSPRPYLPRWLDAGCKVIPVIANATMAKKVADAGATAVVAEGGESGGHVGDLTTMALLSQVCDATDLPVIAAGGIACGRQAAAAFVMGAEGLQIGTRFILAKECGVHPTYKNLILEAGDTDTMLTGIRLGHPVRALKTPFSKNFFQSEYDPAITDEKLEELAAGSLRRASVDGDIEGGSFQAGQVVGKITREQPAAEILQEIYDEMQVALKAAARWVD